MKRALRTPPEHAPAPRRLAAHLVVGAIAALLACASTAPRESYRLGASSGAWEPIRSGPLALELRAAYPEFFAVVLDPRREQEPDLRPLRADLESEPSTPRSYDALNAAAIAYFEFNYRAQSDPGGMHYLADSFRAAKIVALPWRAYGELEDTSLRDAILDFFEDAASGSKQASASTAPRLLRVVDSLRSKETDPGRRSRIDAIVAGLAEASPPH